MRRSMSLVLICGGLTAVACEARTANAADMPPYPQYEPAAVVQEFGSGWYLRGDIGYRTDTKIGDMTSTFPLPTDVDIREIATIGVGGGYKSGWFRSDVTLDYAGKAKFAGDGPTLDAYTGKIESFTTLLNFYLDLGTWNGFTPYIGAGAGAITFRTYDFEAPAGPLTLDYQSNTQFAWAYMAGFAWCFAPRWLVDFSYRRLNMGEVTFNPLLANELTLKDLTANEFRIGLRYNFD
ncbi:MAG: outer membrane protein [Pseudorhodoplanes sp.]|uniref:outer membrane protein n=1 Tax=Pseudorhodoplanes sp. TaxID=1934341 RepID=UPI003D0AA4E0